MSQDIQRSLFVAFNSNRQLIEKWLAYPRQLQQEYGVNPVLAGGAMRDILLGKEVNDLDIFISVSSWRAEQLDNSLEAFDDMMHKMATREGWEPQHESDINSGSDGTHRKLHSVWQFQSAFIDRPYNIVILPEDCSASKVISEFDFGIDMVGINTYSILAISQHFIHDIDKQQITIRNDRARDVQLKRYEKLSQKYPWPLVNDIGMEIEKPAAGLILPPGIR